MLISPFIRCWLPWLIVHLRYLLSFVGGCDFLGDVKLLLGILRKNGWMRSLLRSVLPDFKEANYLINPSYIIGGKQIYLFNILKFQRSIVYPFEHCLKNIWKSKRYASFIFRTTIINNWKRKSCKSIPRFTLCLSIIFELFYVLERLEQTSFWVSYHLLRSSMIHDVEGKH